jgi:hypothetical protein
MKELTMFALVDNLVRIVMLEAAKSGLPEIASVSSTPCGGSAPLARGT